MAKNPLLRLDQTKRDFLVASNKLADLMAEVSMALLDESEEFSNTIDLVLSKLGIYFQVDRAYLFRNSKIADSIILNYTNEWCAEGIDSFLGHEMLSDVPWDAMPEIYHEMLKGEVISGIIRLEKESEFKEVMLQQGIQSYLFFPILIDDHFFGFVGFDSCLSEREWEAFEESFLKTIGVLIAHRFSRNRLQEQLAARLDQENRINFFLKNVQEIRDSFLITNDKNLALQQLVNLSKEAFKFESMAILEEVGFDSEGYHFQLNQNSILPDANWAILNSISGFKKLSSSKLLVSKKTKFPKRISPTKKIGNRRVTCGLHVERLNLISGRPYIIALFYSKDHSAELIDNEQTILFQTFLSLLNKANISEQKSIYEERLKESEAKFRLISENSYDIVCLHDTNGDFQYISPSIKNLLGYKLADLNGKKIEDFIYSIDEIPIGMSYPGFLQQLSDLEKITLPWKTKDGRKIWLQSIFKKIYHDSGDLIGFISTSRDITAEVEAKEELEYNERKFRLITENLSDIVALHNEDLTFYWVSPSLCEQMEVTAEEVIGKHPNDIWPTISSKEKYADPDSGIRITEVEHELKSGKRIWIEIKITPFSDDILGFKGKLAISRDLTERIHFQEKLENQRAAFEMLFEESLGGYWDYYLQTNEEYLSPGFKRILGFEDHELPNSPESWQKYIYKEDLPGLMEALHIHVNSEGKIPFIEQVRYKHRFGHELLILCAGQVIEWTEDGQPIRMIGCHIDLSEQRRLQTRLFEAESALELIMKKTKQVVWIRDMKSREIKYVSESAKDIFEISDADLKTGRRFYFENVYPEDQSILNEVFKSSEYRRLGLIDTKYRIKNKWGEYIWLRTRGFNIYNADQELISRIGIAEDVTDQVISAQEIQNTLEKERELNKMKSYFISMVSHQFRTPMAIIQTNTELIQLASDGIEQLVKQKITKYSGRISGEIKRLTDLLSDILVLEKSQLGKLEMRPVKLELAALVLDIISDFNLQLEDPVKLTIKDELTLTSDENQVRHTLVNIIGNAIKYTQKGSPSPEVTLYLENHEAVVEVKDHGIGILEEDIPRLFNPFFRGGNSAGIQGTGLGLVIAKEFMDGIGGRIEVESKPEKGSVFRCYFPCDKA